MKRKSLLLTGFGSAVAIAAIAAVVPSQVCVSGHPQRRLESGAVSRTLSLGSAAGGVDSRAVARAQEAQSVPWSVDFAKTNFNDFTVIDANEDDITWKLADGEAQASYSAKDQMDDWLITPPLQLQGGHAYTLTFTAAANDNTYEEQLEVFFGDEPTVEAMIGVVKQPFTVAGNQFYEYTGVIVPRKSGKTYVGFHGISEPDRYKLRLKEISLKEGAKGENPAGVGDLEVTTTGPYDLTAEVSFSAPATTMSGAALSSIEYIELCRDGELLKKFDNPVPGEALTYKDEVPTGGEYEYSATAYNKAGAGYTVRHLLHVGGVVPMYPETVWLEELEVPGSMRLTWSPVLKDVEGNDIPEGFVSYVILDTEMNLVAQDVKETSIEFYIPEAEQQFVQFIVAAYTVGGLGEGTMSNMRAVGPAFNSFKESFPNGMPESLMGIGYEFGYVDYVGWDVADDSTFSSEDAGATVSSYDGDNGFAFMQCEYRDTGASLFTGKITLPAVGPAVSFAIFNQSQKNVPDNNLVELMVSENGDDWTTVEARTVYDFCGDRQGWNYVTVGLHDYAGKTVQIRWQVTVQSYAIFLIDALSVGTLPEYDLVAESLSAPAEMRCGQEENVEVRVLNLGSKQADKYFVKLYSNGREVSEVIGRSLAPGKRETLTIPYKVSPVETGVQQLHAEVLFSLDSDESNNRTATRDIELLLSRYPRVTNLAGACDSEGEVSLTWNEPLVSSYTPGETEDFESGEDFAGHFGDWIFIDADQEGIGSLYPSKIPGVEPGVTKASFMVFNSEAPSFNASMAAHSGTKYLASVFSYYGNEIDDWAITPELNGASQVVSFWAKSLEEYYAETMELYYSFGSTDPQDFILITKVDRVPGKWTEYNIPVPVGAKRFAVRNHSKGGMVLLLDDFHFAGADQPVGIELDHYNVYCDGNLVGSAPADRCSFSHKGTNGDREYAVTAVYKGLGESQGSNVVRIKVENGLSGVAEAFAVDALRVEGRVLKADGLAGYPLGVYRLDGTTVEIVETLPATWQKELPAGLYIVRCGARTLKLRIP